MRFFLAFSLIVLIFPQLQAQTGHYYLSHYSSEKQSDGFSFDITQDDAGFMYFATRKGLKQFDGRNWRVVKNKSTIYTITANDGLVYAAGEGTIGVVTSQADFTLAIKTLVYERGTDFFESATIGNDIYFVSEKKLVRYKTVDRKADKMLPPGKGVSFTNIFQVENIAYVSTDDGALYRLEGNKFTLTTIQNITGQVLFSSNYNDQYFIITEDQKLFVKTTNQDLRNVPLSDSEYLKAGVLVNGLWVNENLIALGTLNGGILFINPHTGQTEEIINYYSGLPDNEVYCLKRDAAGNIWVGHEYGFSCVAPQLPFRSFNHYNGLNGNILCAKTFNNKVYVGTSVGLFSLEKEEQFIEEVFYTEKKKVVGETQEAPVIQEAPSKRRGFFRSRKKTEEEKPETIVLSKPKVITERIKQTRKIVTGISYSFKKVEGINSKVEKLITYKNQLYAAGLAGLFSIANNKASALSQEPVEAIMATREKGLVVETYKNRLYVFDGLTERTIVQDMNDDLTAIIEDERDNLWMAGTKTIYRLSIDSLIQTYGYSNPTLDPTTGMSYKGNPLIVNSNGFYTVSNGAVRVIDSLGKPSQFFVSDENLWYRYNETWRCIGSFQSHENLEYLNLFSDLRYIEAEKETEALWIITNNNELFKFFSNQPMSQIANYPLLVRSVRNQKKFFSPGLSTYKLVQDEGQLSVEVVQPTYGSELGAHYRFALAGPKSKSWSEWTNENEFSFPYLPLGNYTIIFQTRDALGKVTELNPIQIRITPPFWKTPWFYAIEFVFFSLLVVASIRLQSMNNNYRVVAQVLAMLTIVLLITLIQASVSTYFVTSSPVTDFAIQVGIAFLILPLELFLRRLMFSSNQNRLKRIINPALKKVTDDI